MAEGKAEDAIMLKLWFCFESLNFNGSTSFDLFRQNHQAKKDNRSLISDDLFSIFYESYYIMHIQMIKHVLPYQMIRLGLFTAYLANVFLTKLQGPI